MFPYTVQSVPKYLTKHDIYMVPNPSKHPDLNPCVVVVVVFNNINKSKVQHEGKNLQRHH